jgi:predicted transcriptional regulator
MTTKEASKEWSCSISTVNRYCKKGYIEGAYIKNKTYFIPDNASRPKISRAKTQIKIIENILNGINESKALYAPAFNIDSEVFQVLLKNLCSEGFIKVIPTAKTDATFYILSEKGIGYINQRSDSRKTRLLQAADLLKPW